MEPTLSGTFNNGRSCCELTSSPPTNFTKQRQSKISDLLSLPVLVVYDADTEHVACQQ